MCQVSLVSILKEQWTQKDERWTQKNRVEILRLIADENLIIWSKYFFVLWLVYLPLEQGIPCRLEESNTATGTILAWSI